MKASKLKIGDRFIDRDGDLAEYIGREKVVPDRGGHTKCGFYNTITEDGSTKIPYIALRLTDDVEKVS